MDTNQLRSVEDRYNRAKAYLIPQLLTHGERDPDKQRRALYLLFIGDIPKMLMKIRGDNSAMGMAADSLATLAEQFQEQARTIAKLTKECAEARDEALHFREQLRLVAGEIDYDSETHEAIARALGDTDAHGKQYPPECMECGTQIGQAHDPTCSVIAGRGTTT